MGRNSGEAMVELDAIRRSVQALRTEPLYPLSFEVILKSLIWGGRRLGTVLKKPIGDGDHYAESWEIADHGDDVSHVRDGPLAGSTLRDLVKSRSDELLGSAVAHGMSERRQFPLLVKFLDANDVLSVQVHPDDERARRLAGDNGKTEVWVVVHAEPGSLIYAGLKAGVSRREFAAAMADGGVEPLLHRFEPRAGDCVLVPAGTVHAIGAGVLVAEIQQMSDATFRIYDWERVGSDGRPRELHPAQALESIDFSLGPVDPIRVEAESIAEGTRERLAACPYFALERFRLTGSMRIGRNDRFTILIALGGGFDVGHDVGSAPTRLSFGETLLLPAILGACQVAPRARDAVVLTCIVP
jgi:mannose-6-phosphate isomerase